MDLIPPCGVEALGSKGDDELALSLIGIFGVFDPDTKSAGTLGGLLIPNVGVLVEMGAESVSAGCVLMLLSGNGGSSGIEFGRVGEADSMLGFALFGKVLGASVAMNNEEGGTESFAWFGLPGSSNALVGMLDGTGVKLGEGKALAEFDEPNVGAGVLLKASKPLDVPGELEGPLACKGESVLPGPDTSGNVSIPIRFSYSCFNGVSVPFRAMYPLYSTKSSNTTTKAVLIVCTSVLPDREFKI